MTWVMLVGGLLWLTGEVWGVVHRRRLDTTSDWVWAAEHRWAWSRVLVAAFVVWLGTHLVFGWYW